MKIKVVHGFTQNRMAFTPFCNLLEVVADTEVSIIEAPHHGDSPLRGGSLYDAGRHLEELYGDEDAVFVGYSLGGRILLEALSSGALSNSGVIVSGAAIDEGDLKARLARIEARAYVGAGIGHFRRKAGSGRRDAGAQPG